MAITRSRNAPKKESGDEASLRSHTARNDAAGSSDPKTSKRGSADRLAKARKIVKPPKKVDRNSRVFQIKIEDDNRGSGKGGKTERDIVKSEIFRSASIDTKGKKLPAYKVEQLQRLHKLINMSLVAKPRGPVTYRDYMSEEEGRQSSDSLRISLDRSNKTKMSNATHYDPVRQRLLEGKLTNSEKVELAILYDKVRNFRSIKAPELSDDLTLRKVLDEVAEKNQTLKFWNYFNERLETEEFGNTILLANERRLQSHGISEIQKNNLLEQQNSAREIKVKREGDVDFPENSLQKYSKINVERVAIATDLERMLESASSILEKDPLVSEESAFSGLKLADYTTSRNFGNEKA